MSLPSTRLWSAGEKLAFRFFFVFFALFIFPFPLTFLPYAGELYEQLWQLFIPWAGAHILHLPDPITIFTNGSGDTTFDYVKAGAMLVLAALAALIWAVADRRRRNYDTLHHWLRVWLRYYVAYMMFIYGFAKIFHLQMPSPYLSQLVQPFGDKSPMGLAWSYVGYSKAFSAFTGWAEVVAGLFLLFRRTTLLGAVLSAFVTVNIVAINFCFDVPVKLFSSFLLLVSLFLMAPDVKRLANLFILNKPVQPKVFRTYVHKRWMRVSAVVLKSLFIIFILYSQIEGSMGGMKRYGDDRAKPPLFGIYNTELLVRNHDTVPPLMTDTTRWRQLIIQFERNAQVKLMNDSLKYLNFRVDTSLKTATVFSREDTTRKSVLHYTADSAYLTLTGVLNNDSVMYRFRKFDHRSFRLLSRGFRWVNEYPYNR
ncbi:DoxX family protein [Chitinophaga sp. YIM B06452]|uniref:DoxX family protein n=1 Tax=Chitinophaga sp. YIM B06452 TaxID=3082158 RepID=UPI0031FE48EF